MPPIKLLAFKRKAWKPVVVDGDGPRTSSKFSGTPWLAADEIWPMCSNCGKPMLLCVQLNRGDLPQPLKGEFGSGLLQLFYSRAFCNHIKYTRRVNEMEKSGAYASSDF